MSTDQPTAAADRDETVVMWASVAVWSLVAVLAALLSAVLVPIVVRGITVPLGLLIVLPANVLLPRVFAREIGIKGGALIPGLIWLVIAIAAATATSERDLILPSNSHSAVWSFVYLGLGSVAAAFGAFTASTSFAAWRSPRRPSEPSDGT